MTIYHTIVVDNRALALILLYYVLLSFVKKGYMYLFLYHGNLFSKSFPRRRVVLISATLGRAYEVSHAFRSKPAGEP